jgi:transcriptional regulator with XRE-family HTH domain
MDLASMSSGERVRALRKANGMTLADLADAVDVSVSMLNRIELGRRPLGELAVSIAAALGVSERDLTAPPDERVPGEVREAYCDQLLTRLSREDDVSIVRGTTLDAYVPLYFAVRRGIVDANPFAAVRYVKPRASRKSDHGVWSYSDLCAIADAIRGQWWEPAWLLSAFGGLRVSESLGVKADEVRALSVHGVPVVLVPVLRQAHPRRRDVSDRLKTAQSRRVVPIAGPAAERLAQLAAERAGDWLTSDGTGVIVYRLTYVNAVRSFMRDSAFDDHPVRNLRNSWETYMRWEWCMNPRFTEPVMGHAVDGTTGTYYDRPSDEQVAGVFADAYKDFMARKDMTA